jgi:hypothetical protein
MSVMPIAPSVPEDAYAAEVWEDESPATPDTGGEEGCDNWIHSEDLPRVEWTMSRASPLGEDANPLALRPATCSLSPVKGTAMGGLAFQPLADPHPDQRLSGAPRQG